MTTFPCRSDDFCIEHGYEYMRSRLGDPICFCQACEDEKEKATTTPPVPSLEARATERKPTANSETQNDR